MTMHSMTGFGQARLESGGLELSAEIKSVNHRFLDVVMKLPAVYAPFELQLSKLVREKLSRGRVEVFVARANKSQPLYDIAFNKDLFRAYVTVIKEAVSSLDTESEEVFTHAVSGVLNKREVLELQLREEDSAGEIALVSEVVKQAVAALLQMREREGAALEKELKGLLAQLSEVVNIIEQRAQAVPVEYRERLNQRLEKLAAEVPIDPDRLAQEAALIADRSDATEELARLRSHLEQFNTAIDEAQGGRKMDFLLQEIGRELNTTGSKSQDSAITNKVIEGKALAEKLREQVQNIE